MTNAIDIATSFSGRLDRSRLYEMESVFLGVASLPLLCGVAVGTASPRTLALNETLPDGERCRICKNAHRPARCPNDAIFATMSSEITPPSHPAPHPPHAIQSS